MLPAVIAETPALNPGPDAPPWQTRLVPNKFAAEIPFETWIAPRRHRADFGDITAAEGAGLASRPENDAAYLHRALA